MSKRSCEYLIGSTALPMVTQQIRYSDSYNPLFLTSSSLQKPKRQLISECKLWQSQKIVLTEDKCDMAVGSLPISPSIQRIAVVLRHLCFPRPIPHVTSNQRILELDGEQVSQPSTTVRHASLDVGAKEANDPHGEATLMGANCLWGDVVVDPRVGEVVLCLSYVYEPTDFEREVGFVEDGDLGGVRHIESRLVRCQVEYQLGNLGKEVYKFGHWHIDTAGVGKSREDCEGLSGELMEKWIHLPYLYTLWKSCVAFVLDAGRCSRRPNNVGVIHEKTHDLNDTKLSPCCKVPSSECLVQVKFCSTISINIPPLTVLSSTRPSS